MATSTTISGMTALATSPATGDLLVIVDVSDPSEAATGTTKKITVANLFSAPAIAAPTMTAPTVTSGGLLISAGGLTISAGGATVTGPIVATNSAAPLAVNNTAAAGVNAAVIAQRGSSTKYFIGFDASDQFAILNAAGNAVNIGSTDAGVVSVRAGLSVLAGTVTFVGYGSGTGVVSVGAADSGGAGFKLLRVPN